MWGWIKGKFKSPTPAPRTLAQEVAEDCACPVCQSKDALLAGPSGGMSQNVMCSFCGTRLNIHHTFGGLLLGVDWEHGPQPRIWGGEEATIFPSEEAVAEAKTRLETEK